MSCKRDYFSAASPVFLHHININQAVSYFENIILQYKIYFLVEHCTKVTMSAVCVVFAGYRLFLFIHSIMNRSDS